MNIAFRQAREKWETVYKKHSVSSLPWYRLPFISHVAKFLNTLDAQQVLLVPGCGAGDTAEKLRNKGFEHVMGTDISLEAIILAQNRFPHILFEHIPTERLYRHKEYRNANVIDWLNLHQIAPQELQPYMKSLEKISDKLYLAYFYDPKRPRKQKSIITEGYVYNHPPERIVALLQKMKKIHESSFTSGTNPEFDEHNRFRTVAQIYVRK